MEYIWPKLQLNRYKKDQSHILYRKIVQEVDYETKTKLNFSLDSNLSLWIIRLLSLHPKYSVGPIHLFDRTAIDALIADYFQIVSDADNLFVAIVKMQVFYMNNFIEKNRIIAKHQSDMNEKMRPLTELIINTRLKSKTECDDYVKKLAVDIIAYYALGNPENAQVVQETINALKSMMSTNDVIAFSTLSEKDKIESLSGIREIVCGMRAFNRDAGHCGEGLVDIEKIVRNGYKTTKFQLTASLKEITNRLDSIIEPLTARLTYDSTPQQIENFNAIKAITLNRQCERYLQDLLITLDDHQLHIDRYLKKFRCQLNRIHETVKFRTAIPITSIFPKFIELAKLWEQLQHQTYILSDINTVNEQLMAFAQSHSFDCTDVEPLQVIRITQHSNYDAKDDVHGDKSIYSGSQKVDGTKIVNASKIEHIKIVSYDANLKIQYESFCTWTISIANGLLLSSDLSIGIIQYKSRCYAFRSVAAANLFMQNPDICLNRVNDVICRNPELVLYFNMYDMLQSHNISSIGVAYNDGDQSGCRTFEHCSIGIQTDIHPIPYAKDPNHIWNVWDWRRRAIEMANVERSATKSTQTYCHSAHATQTN